MMAGMRRNIFQNYRPENGFVPPPAPSWRQGIVYVAATVIVIAVVAGIAHLTTGLR
jgi:hypothetical protein